jgi:hypothetical protein
MNIQDTITELGLDNDSLPRILKQRVATVLDLQSKIELAEEEVSDDPTEDNKAKLNEIKEYSIEYFNDAKGQLESYKRRLDKQSDAKAKEDADAKAKEDADVKPNEDDEKKSSGLGALLIGGVLLVATLGAVNIMRKS